MMFVKDVEWSERGFSRIQHVHQCITICVVRISARHPKDRMTDDTKSIASYFDSTLLMGSRCKYCNMIFRRNRSWQEFCCSEHRNLWHTSERERVVKDLGQAVCRLIEYATELGGDKHKIESLVGAALDFRQRWETVKD